MIRVRIDRAGRVRTEAEAWTPLLPASVWGEMRAFTVFAAADPFHRKIVIDGGVPRPGAGIEIVHSYLGITVRRSGRILRWREGKGFVFSDISRRGRRHGFPHIFSFDLRPDPRGGSTIHLDVRGRWTAMWIPRPFIFLWQWWVMLQIRDAIQTHLLWLSEVKKASRRKSRLEPMK